VLALGHDGGVNRTLVVVIISMMVIGRVSVSVLVVVGVPLGWVWVWASVAPDLRWRQRDGQLLVVIGLGHGCPKHNVLCSRTAVDTKVAALV
jgi:hypothetical protein